MMLGNVFMITCYNADDALVFCDRVRLECPKLQAGVE